MSTRRVFPMNIISTMMKAVAWIFIIGVAVGCWLGYQIWGQA